MRLNLIDLALEHPKLLGLLGFRLPDPPDGRLRLRDVRVEKDGIRVRLQGTDLAVGRS